MKVRKEDVDAAIAVCLASGEDWAEGVAQLLAEMYRQRVSLLSASLGQRLQSQDQKEVQHA